MKHIEFSIGLEFWCGATVWRCTDVGSRVIVAISLDPHEFVEIEHVPGHQGLVYERRFKTSDPTWLNGPPFAVVEHVFDEHSMEGCSLTPDVNDLASTGG